MLARGGPQRCASHTLYGAAAYYNCFRSIGRAHFLADSSETAKNREKDLRVECAFKPTGNSGAIAKAQWLTTWPVEPRVCIRLAYY